MNKQLVQVDALAKRKCQVEYPCPTTKYNLNFMPLCSQEEASGPKSVRVYVLLSLTSDL